MAVIEPAFLRAFAYEESIIPLPKKKVTQRCYVSEMHFKTVRQENDVEFELI